MRPVLLVLAGMSLLAFPVSARSIVDVGAVALDVDADESEDCTVGLDEELCLASVDTHGTTSPGDDDIVLRKTVDAVRLRLRPPVGPGSGTFTFSPSDLRVGHALFQTVNGTWVALNDTLPGDVKTWVTLESRPPIGEPGNWGIFVVLHLPMAIETPLTNRYEDFGMPVACWDLWCETISPSDVVVSDEDDIQFFPNDVVVDDWDTDGFSNENAYDVTHYCEPALAQEPCTVMAPLQGPSMDAVAVVETLTPRVSHGLRLHRAEVAFEDATFPRLAGRGGPAQGTSLGSRAAEGELHARGEPRSLAQAADVGTRPMGLTEVSASKQDASVGSVQQSLGIDLPGWWPPLLAGAIGLGFLAWALYHRIYGKDVALHPHRQRVIGYVREHPGCSMAELAAFLGLSFKSAEHHVRVLERSGCVRALRANRRVALSLAGGEREARRAAVLRHPKRRELFRLVQAHPGLHAARLAAMLGLSRSTLHRHVHGLLDAQLVEERGGGLFAAEVFDERPVAVATRHQGASPPTGVG